MFMMGQFTGFFQSLFDKKKGTNAKSGYTYIPPGRPLRKSGNGFCFVVSGVLFLIFCLWLSFFSPFSWQALLTGITRLPAGLSEGLSEAISRKGHQETVSAEQQDRPVLRGTIYDRNMKEMSVSYRLFSLLVQPADLPNREQAAEQLALILNREQQDILGRLQPADGIVELAGDLEIRSAPRQ